MSLKNETVKLKYKFTNWINEKKISVYFSFHKLKNERCINTHLTDEEKIELHKISTNLRSKNPIIVEIGSYLGASSCFLGNGLNKFGKLYCIDSWEVHYEEFQEIDVYKEFLNNIKKYKDKITILKGQSSLMINKIEETRIDLLFIDGNHSYDSVKKDWELYSPLLISGSIVIFHDTGWAEGVNKIIKEFVSDKNQKIIELPNMQAYKIS